MNSTLIIEKEIQKDIVFIKPDGIIDADTFDELDKYVEDLFKQDFYKLVFDMSDVKYINSAGAGVILYCNKITGDYNGKVIILAPSANVKEIFDLLNMDVLFDFCGTKEEAIEHFLKE